MNYGRFAALAGAAMLAATAGGCGKGISGAIDAPPLYPVEQVQPPDARWERGMSHEYGRGLMKNEEAAIADYRLAVQRGDVRAMVDLGVMLLQGRGVARDYSEGVTLLRRAAVAGSAIARYDIALLYLSGEGVSVDTAESVRFAREAAKQGHVRAMVLTASLIESGNAPALYANDERKWRDEAAIRGEPVEIARIVPAEQRRDPRRPVVSDAVRRLVSENCAECRRPDVDRSAREYVFTATDGHPGAIYQLGIRNRDGDGLPKDVREAARLFGTAARMGHAASQYELARMRIDGIGIAKDPREAEALLIAASRADGEIGWRARDLRRRLETGLSSGEMSDALKRADDYRFGEVDQYGRPR
jgi:TPR repeat protein